MLVPLLVLVPVVFRRLVGLNGCGCWCCLGRLLAELPRLPECDRREWDEMELCRDRPDDRPVVDREAPAIAPAGDNNTAAAAAADDDDDDDDDV